MPVTIAGVDRIIGQMGMLRSLRGEHRGNLGINIDHHAKTSLTFKCFEEVTMFWRRAQQRRYLLEKSASGGWIVDYTGKADLYPLSIGDLVTVTCMDGFFR